MLVAQIQMQGRQGLADYVFAVAPNIPHAAISVCEACRMRTTEISQVNVALAFAYKVIASSQHAPGSVQRLAVDSFLVARPPPSRDDERCPGLVHEHPAPLVHNPKPQPAHHHPAPTRISPA